MTNVVRGVVQSAGLDVPGNEDDSHAQHEEYHWSQHAALGDRSCKSCGCHHVSPDCRSHCDCLVLLWKSGGLLYILPDLGFSGYKDGFALGYMFMRNRMINQIVVPLVQCGTVEDTLLGDQLFKRGKPDFVVVMAII